MARLVKEIGGKPDVWIVYDDDGGFTEFNNEEDAQAFLEDLE